MARFVHRQKVLFQHCDPAGIVFYPRYFEMLNATVEAWFADRLGLSFAEIHGPMRRGVPTASLHAEFRAPSRLGDLLDFELVPVTLGRASCCLRQCVRCADALRGEFTQTLVWITMDSGRPERWPDTLRARIQDHLETEGKRP